LGREHKTKGKTVILPMQFINGIFQRLNIGQMGLIKGKVGWFSQKSVLVRFKS
jgi:hypothetical protein